VEIGGAKMVKMAASDVMLDVFLDLIAESFHAPVSVCHPLYYLLPKYTHE
jgi:hypothetical protein